MMKALIFISLALLVYSDLSQQEYRDVFIKWKAIYSKQYENSMEEDQKFKNFMKSVDEIQELNSKQNAWEAGLGPFSDQDKQELVKSKLMEPQYCSATNSFPLMKSNGYAPSHLDWRDRKFVSPVKNQGKCGSCWTFSATGCMEAHWAMYNNITFEKGADLLAEQQLVDCAGDFNNFGCNGGLPSQAFEYLYYEGGQNSEEQYPYNAVEGDTCNIKKPFTAKLRGESVNMTDENDILYHVTNVGPVSIAYDVIDDFFHYTSGVYHSDKCGSKPSEVNHAVLVVGFGHDNKSGLDYWIVKNSWGTSWGMDGYFLIQRGVNMCGIADCASFPDVAGVYKRKN